MMWGWVLCRVSRACRRHLWGDFLDVGSLFLPSGYLRCLSHLLLFTLLSKSYFFWYDPSLSSSLIPRTTCEPHHQQECSWFQTQPHLPLLWFHLVPGSIYLCFPQHTSSPHWTCQLCTAPLSTMRTQNCEWSLWAAVPKSFDTRDQFHETYFFSSGAAVERLVLGWSNTSRLSCTLFVIERRCWSHRRYRSTDWRLENPALEHPRSP